LNEPLSKGKPLGHTWLRELKVKHIRIYYLINIPKEKVLLICISTKKNQQTKINSIKNKLTELKDKLHEPKVTYMVQRHVKEMKKEIRALENEQKDLIETIVNRLKKMDLEHHNAQ